MNEMAELAFDPDEAEGPSAEVRRLAYRAQREWELRECVPPECDLGSPCEAHGGYVTCSICSKQCDQDDCGYFYVDTGDGTGYSPKCEQCRARMGWTTAER